MFNTFIGSQLLPWKYGCVIKWKGLHQCPKPLSSPIQLPKANIISWTTVAKGGIYTSLSGNHWNTKLSPWASTLGLMGGTVAFSAKSGLNGKHGGSPGLSEFDLRSSASATIFWNDCDVHQLHRFPDPAEVGISIKARVTLYKKWVSGLQWKGTTVIHNIQIIQSKKKIFVNFKCFHLHTGKQDFGYCF